MMGDSGQLRQPTKTPVNERQVVSDLRAMAITGLARMYLPSERLFVFRLRKTRSGIQPEGVSRRYTAISLIGLAREATPVVAATLQGHSLFQVSDRLRQDIARVDNLGDVALTLWAACAIGDPDRRSIRERLETLASTQRPQPTVELSWALTALCSDLEAPPGKLSEQLATRLVTTFGAKTGLFPAVVGHDGLRSHVACFADLVYPIHALSMYARKSGHHAALDAASRCAETICRLQGAAGQWWWHYDRRTGDVFERYPVYAIHQDAMAPMALTAVREAGGPDCDHALQKGLDWLADAPEIGASLIDLDNDLIWRSVFRRGTSKSFRAMQALASRIHPALRVPGLDTVFPPVAVDYEDRPYHLGWLLYAWPEDRANRWDRQGDV